MNKNLRWAHDFDYLDKLSPEDREWMNKFIGEYYDGSVKKGDSKALHKSDKLRKDCYQKKNRQNNDVVSIQDSGGKMERFDEQNPEKKAKD